MENAADALKMAAAVLIFVVALSISINAFGQVRLASRTILEYNDKEYNYTYVEDNGTTKRIVGIESIIPTIYKAYKENYKIIFDEDILGEDGLYQIDEFGNKRAIYTIDLDQSTSEIALGYNRQKEQLLLAILYGRNCMNIEGNEEIYSNYSTYEDLKTAFRNNNLGIYLNDSGIYDTIKDIELEESVGVYYQDEAGETEESSVPETNRIIKRVITYSMPTT